MAYSAGIYCIYNRIIIKLFTRRLLYKASLIISYTLRSDGCKNKKWHCEIEKQKFGQVSDRQKYTLLLKMQTRCVLICKTIQKPLDRIKMARVRKSYLEENYLADAGDYLWPSNTTAQINNALNTNQQTGYLNGIRDAVVDYNILKWAANNLPEVGKAWCK